MSIASRIASDSREDISEHTSLWRYMSLAKLIRMLETKSLYMARVDKLGDAWEGSCSPLTRKGLLPRYVDTIRHLTPQDVRRYIGIPNVPFPGMDGTDSSITTDMAFTGISCWHISDSESIAMWEVYAQGSRGVSVKSSLAQLKRAFAGRPNVDFREVQYIDYYENPFLGQAANDFLSRKRRAFLYERELRVLLRNEKNLPISRTNLITGWDVDVPLEVLITSVVVAPNQPDWFIESMQSLFRAYGYKDIIVERSSIDQPPSLRGDDR